MHSQDAPRQDFSVLSDAEVPRLDPHHVIKHELQVQAAFHAHLIRGENTTPDPRRLLTANGRRRQRHLCEHGLPILSHHGALVAVQGHKVAVEGLLRVLQNIEQLGGAALENAPKVSWNQRPADGCREEDEALAVTLKQDRPAGV